MVPTNPPSASSLWLQGPNEDPAAIFWSCYLLVFRRRILFSHFAYVGLDLL